jgi:hypothetical protein
MSQRDLVLGPSVGVYGEDPRWADSGMQSAFSLARRGRALAATPAPPPVNARREQRTVSISRPKLAV